MFHSHDVFEAGRVVFSRTGETKNVDDVRFLRTFVENITCNTSTQHRLRRYDESEDDSEMLREWEDLDGGVHIRSRM